MGIKDKIKGFDWATACTVCSCVGTVGTGIFSAVGGMKMAGEWDSEMSLLEKVKLVVKHEWPAIVCGAVTIGLDILSRHLDKKTIAKLSAAVALGASQMNDYRAEVRKEVGAEKEAEIFNNSFDRLQKDADGIDEVVHRFRDPYNKIFFDATMGDIWRGLANMNERLWNRDLDDYGFVTMDLFYIGMNKSKLVTEKMFTTGWTPYILEADFGANCIGFWLDPKKDRLGRTYYILTFDKDPCDDIQQRTRELEIVDGIYER